MFCPVAKWPCQKSVSFSSSGRGVDEHPVRPPQPKPLCLDVVGREAVEELVDDWLQTTLRAGRQDFFAEPFAALASEPNRLCSTWRKRIHPRIPDAGFLERLQGACVNRFVVNEARHRAFGCHRRKATDLLRCRAKAGSFDQMRRTLVVPVRGGDGSQIALPAIRRINPCAGWDGERTNTEQEDDEKGADRVMAPSPREL